MGHPGDERGMNLGVMYGKLPGRPPRIAWREVTIIRRMVFVLMLTAGFWAAGPIVHGLSPGRGHGTARNVAWADDGEDRGSDSADRDGDPEEGDRGGGDPQPADDSQTPAEDGGSAVVVTSSVSGSGASTAAPNPGVQQPADHSARMRSGASVPVVSSGIRSGMLGRGAGPLESGHLQSPSVQQGAAISFEFVRWLTYLGGGLAAAFSILIGAGFWAKRKVLRR